MADIKDFKLPDLGEGLESGTIVSWEVEVGDMIELNQTVAEVETAKAVVAVPSPYAGKIVETIGEVGEELEVGSVFVRIDVGVEGGEVADEPVEPTEAGQQADEATTEAKPKSTGLDADEEPQPLVGYGQKGGGGRRRRRGKKAAVSGNGQAGAATTGRPLAKPPVRKLAKDHGIDLAELMPGSGPDGIITRQDVLAATEQAEAAPAAPAAGATATAPAVSRAPEPELRTAGAGEKPVPGFRGRYPGEVEKVAGIRKRIITKMEQSRRDIPHALCSREADLTDLWELRKELTAQASQDGFDVKITPYTLVMRATVLALRRFPTLNAVYDQDAGEIRLLEHINLGLAVDTDRGLIVANIKDAHAKSTLQIAKEAAELAQKCRDGSATPADLTGGTFTTDNYGFFGNDDGNPIINAPEVGILGVGAIREKPWVVDGEVVPRRVCKFTLAFDHRVCDGGEAGRFVTYVADLCETPTKILLHS